VSKEAPPFFAIFIIAAALFVASFHGDEILLHRDFDKQFLSPSFTHPMGTDRFGRDVLLYAIAGLGYSIYFAFAAIVFAAVVGTALGTLWRLQAKTPVGLLIGEFVTATLSIPPLIIVLAILLVTAGDRLFVSVLVGVIFAPYIARLIHQDLTKITEADYFLVERLLGIPYYDSFIRIALPNSLRVAFPTLIALTADIVGLDAALSFLGFSLQPVAPGIGQLLRQGLADVHTAWWICTGPALLLGSFVIDLNRYSFQRTRSLT
jgi:peptide/nickel transport system permease protein